MTAQLATDIVGREATPLSQHVDARWLMAYAAGLGETDPRYFDTIAASGPMAHPLFPVCYEWPVALALRAAAIPEALAPLSVHATHRLVITRLPRAGETLVTSARIVGVRRRRAGTLVTTRLTTRDADGHEVTCTDYGSVYRGVMADGDHELGPAGTLPVEDDPAIAWTDTVDIPAGAAHVYTECARIWNPIHTDLAVARSAGLPGLILHGTATLALAVSHLVDRELGGDPSRVKEIAVRFTGMVRLPSRITIRGRAARGRDLPFDAVDEQGGNVLTGGLVRA